ncbi:hypothetical protein KIP58_22025 [Xanthomonas campestris pv. campestris]|nr:hypothetical protein [Xanthomonas campestris]MCF8861665.1 hypothetical protein [Xanthomonas campestris pv. campestris]
MFGDYSTLSTYQNNPNYYPPAPRAPGSSMFGNSGLGFNMDTLQLGLSGLSTVGNLWNAFQAQKLAKQQFAFTKDITNANLANQIKSYNTTLSDRARSRGVVEGQSQDSVDQYIRDNSLSR